MKFIAKASIVSLLFFLWPASATFDDIFGGGGVGGSFINPDGFDLTTVLNCASDAFTSRFNVPLVPFDSSSDDVDHDYWVPEPSGFPYPSFLRWAESNFDLVVSLLPELQGIDRAFQALNPADVENAYLFARDTIGLMPPYLNSNFSAFNIFDDFDYRPFARQLEACNDIYIRLNATGEDALDDPDAISRNTLEGEALASVGITLDQQPSDAMRDIFNAFRCRVINAWRDLGETYIPRYAIAGRCFNRGCGFPVRNGQICRPDFREVNYRRMEALRWDCCWEFTDDPPRFDSRQRFNCGFRRVNIPVLCDCDCSCPRPAKPI